MLNPKRNKELETIKTSKRAHWKSQAKQKCCVAEERSQSKKGEPVGNKPP